MAKTIELLLLNNVENLGIVGDIVHVKPGYARNYLLPMQLAEFPTAEKIESLKEARAIAQAEMERLRAARQGVIEQINEMHVEIVRAANDLGALYGSVSQRDIADALAEAGHEVELRAIRLKNAIKRTGEYHVPIQFDRDLKGEVIVVVKSDQPIEELEEDLEGEVTEADVTDEETRSGGEGATADAERPTAEAASE